MNEPFLTGRLADFLSWREGLEGQIESLRRTLSYHELFDDKIQIRLDVLLARIRSERLTIAFVAEAGRGKSELINALFFSERGARLLPSGLARTTLCVTELRHDRELPPCLRLLPIETRESPNRFAELLEDQSIWKVIPFNYEDSESIQRAFGSLAETRRVTLGEAVALGLHGDAISKPNSGSAALVDIPRWRHAIINLPHPLLQAGLVVLDTPGLSALAAEPELSRHRIPDADCVAFILDAKDGVTKADLAIWKDYLGSGAMKFGGGFGRAPETTPSNRLVILNKIDLLHQEGRPNSEVLREIDRKVKEAADLLRVEPIRVIPLSAQMGLIGKTTQDRDKLVRSRLYQLERGITRELSNARQSSLSGEIQRQLSEFVAVARAKLDESRFVLLGQLRELGELREKNQRLVGSLTQKASSHHDRLHSAAKEMRGLRAVHSRLGEELAEIINLKKARQTAEDTSNAISGSLLAGAIQATVDAYIDTSRKQISETEKKIDEIKDMFNEVFRKMKEEYGIAIGEVLPFPTQRFQSELQKVESQAELEFKRPSNLLLRRGIALGELFEEVVGNKIVHIFVIAARESNVWMRGLLAELERPFENYKENTTQREEGMEKLRSAELDLAEKISEMQAQLDIIRSRHDAISDCSVSLERHFGRTTKEGIT